ncbi:MAG: PEGA domain-containing protein [Chromatiales bacterium]|nr:MAG: PEGA domain-containing protein [Chromatiales bacterium]
MSLEIRVDTPAGERRFGPGDLPLALGAGADCALRVPGAVGSAPIAQVSDLDGRPLLQPAPGARLVLNGNPVDAARWLTDGDVIGTDTARIECAIADGQWHFRVAQTQDEYQTLPPEIEAAPAEDEPVITAVARQRRDTVTGRTDEPSPQRRWRYAVWAALGILLAVALFLFTAQAIRLDVEPVAAEIQIAGGLVKVPFGGRYLLWPGEYRVLLSAEGYAKQVEDIRVLRGPSQEFRFEMTKLPGRIVVLTGPGVPAEVSVDGAPAGTAPTDEIELVAGPHALRVVAERYLPLETSVEVEGLGRRQEVTVTLEPAWADVRVTTTPPEAEVFVGEDVLGVTPGTIELLAGTHELVIRRDGYTPWRQQLTVEPGQQIELPAIELAVADGILTVRSQPAGAAVSINNRYRGTTPVDAELKPGASYNVIVSKAGYTTVTRRVNMPDRQPKTLKLTLEPVLGEVRIVGMPADATVLVDGRSVGQGQQTLTLPARAHDILVRKAGFADFRAQVTPKPGLPQLVEVRMLTEAQAVLARTPRKITTGQGAKLVLVDPGQFRMGAPRREQGRRANETEREVRLTRRFYIATKEVTNSEYRAFSAQHTSGAETFRELSIGDHPAVMLSWADAVAYCNWLSAQDGLPPAYVALGGAFRLADPATNGYRLPTEAEWAWAARHNAGAETLKYPWGPRMPPTSGAGNFADRSAKGVLTNVLKNYNDGFPVTSPVGQFRASVLGLHDLGGNAAEWMHDLYSVNTRTSGVTTDPLGADKGQYHVIRGSSWRHASISELRWSFRDFGDRGRLDVGFRLARWVDADGAEN